MLGYIGYKRDQLEYEYIWLEGYIYWEGYIVYREIPNQLTYTEHDTSYMIPRIYWTSSLVPQSCSIVTRACASLSPIEYAYYYYVCVLCSVLRWISIHTFWLECFCYGELVCACMCVCGWVGVCMCVGGWVYVCLCLSCPWYSRF